MQGGGSLGRLVSLVACEQHHPHRLPAHLVAGVGQLVDGLACPQPRADEKGQKKMGLLVNFQDELRGDARGSGLFTKGEDAAMNSGRDRQAAIVAKPLGEYGQ